ncbi:arpA protein [Nocardia sp. NPDC050406]|uniref:HalD/BesD family halogenase n=1 Tax=Nocardia sp. NPDC050406 TaxID=3364318 RepID=UPI0037B336E1
MVVAGGCADACSANGDGIAADSVIAAVDTERYPLDAPEGERWVDAVRRARAELAADGCCVLRGFLRDSALETLRAEGVALAPRAYYTVERVNAYNISLDTALPEDHPGRVVLERGNAFVARDLIPAETLIQRLYTSTVFQRFVADCFGLAELHEFTDPLAGLCLNVVAPGMSHPWHFDTNEFTVSMLTQLPDAGGVFEYCPAIRSKQAENFDDVRAVLEGRGEGLIRRLDLRPGDLQLFQGRFSLHRVSPVHGETQRHTAIFAYSETTGVIGTAERSRQLFGRVLPEHLDRAQAVRGDRLLD